MQIHSQTLSHFRMTTLREGPLCCCPKTPSSGSLRLSSFSPLYFRSAIQRRVVPAPVPRPRRQTTGRTTTMPATSTRTTPMPRPIPRPRPRPRPMPRPRTRTRTMRRTRRRMRRRTRTSSVSQLHIDLLPAALCQLLHIAELILCSGFYTLLNTLTVEWLCV